jgi:hypothetical protein
VPRAECFGIAIGPAAQIRPGSGTRVVGADLVGGAADVVVQLEVGMGHEGFLVDVMKERAGLETGVHVRIEMLVPARYVPGQGRFLPDGVRRRSCP